MAQGVAVFSRSQTTPMTNISEFPRMFVDDQVVNISKVTVRILGIDTPPNGIVESLSPTTGRLLPEQVPESPCPYGVGDFLNTLNATHPSDRWPGTLWESVIDQSLVGAGGKFNVGESVGDSDAILLYHNHAGATPAGQPTAQNNTNTGNPTDLGAISLKGYGNTLGAGSTGWRFGSGGSQYATGIATMINHVHSGNYYLYPHQHTIPADGTNETAVNRNYHPSKVVYIWLRIE